MTQVTPRYSDWAREDCRRNLAEFRRFYRPSPAARENGPGPMAGVGSGCRGASTQNLPSPVACHQAARRCQLTVAAARPSSTRARAPGDLFSRAIWCLRTPPDGSAGPAPCTPSGAWARASSRLAWGDGCRNATGDRLGPRRGRTAGDRRRPPVFPRPTTTCGGLER